MICTCLLATLSLVPYPVKAAEKTGMVPQDTAVRYETDAKIPAEGYRLTVAADGITVTSSDEAGRFYAGQTLAQLLDPAKKSYPCVEIEDAPAFRWRGMHLDEGRHFFGKDAVRAILDTMAMHKLNVFHWHLTEDQGWRIDVPGHPELVKFGAVRASGLHGLSPAHEKPPGAADRVRRQLRNLLRIAQIMSI